VTALLLEPGQDSPTALEMEQSGAEEMLEFVLELLPEFGLEEAGLQEW
jgi:hypothetical protein